MIREIVNRRRAMRPQAGAWLLPIHRLYNHGLPFAGVIRRMWGLHAAEIAALFLATQTRLSVPVMSFGNINK
jgi:hypothetical protein